MSNDAVRKHIDGSENYIGSSSIATTSAISELLDALEADPHRRPFEKETRLLWSREGSRCEVYTADRATAKRLLCHPDFGLQWFEYADRERSRTTYRGEPDDIGDAWDGQMVYAIEGTIPIGAVSVKSRPRSDSSTADVVSGRVLDNDPREESE